MKTADSRSEFILDEDKNINIVHTFNYLKDIPNRVFYTKSKLVNTDFMGNSIENINNWILIKSLCFSDLKAKTKVGIIPFGNYDIDNALIIEDYLYYIKTTDKDKDGILKNDYNNGDIYRINIYTFKQEFCCHIDSYEFSAYEIADEQFLIFSCSEDTSDDMYVFIIDLINKRKAVITNTFDYGPECIDYEFIPDDNGLISYLIIKKLIEEGKPGSSDDKLKCITWKRLLDLLEWEDMEQ